MEETYSMKVAPKTVALSVLEVVHVFLEVMIKSTEMRRSLN